MDNENCICYYFDDMININDLDLGNILLDENSYKSVLLYDISYITSLDTKSLRIIFDNEDEYIRNYDGTKYLTVFHSNEKYDRIFDRVRYLIMLKRNILDFYFHKYRKVKINTDDELPLEKILNMHNVQ